MACSSGAPGCLHSVACTLTASPCQIFSLTLWQCDDSKQALLEAAVDSRSKESPPNILQSSAEFSEPSRQDTVFRKLVRSFCAAVRGEGPRMLRVCLLRVLSSWIQDFPAGVSAVVHARGSFVLQQGCFRCTASH